MITPPFAPQPAKPPGLTSAWPTPINGADCSWTSVVGGMARGNEIGMVFSDQGDVPGDGQDGFFVADSCKVGLPWSLNASRY